MSTTGMDEIRKAILAKVEAEARATIEEAEARARDEVARAQKERGRRYDEARRRLEEETERETARIRAQAQVAARQEELAGKSAVIAELTERVRSALEEAPRDDDALLGLIREAVDGLGAAKARLYCSPRDVPEVKRLLKSERALGARIAEVREYQCLGGVIAEDPDGKVRIDNTYETRLEMLLPRILPDIQRELFPSS
ncbi:MAG: V-type ATP synthase subunit E [Chloroflexota bacterium]|nr:V-type ATP synthase subunit E [Chloroflexota bacterium]